MSRIARIWTDLGAKPTAHQLWLSTSPPQESKSNQDFVRNQIVPADPPSPHPLPHPYQFPGGQAHKHWSSPKPCLSWTRCVWRAFRCPGTHALKRNFSKRGAPPSAPRQFLRNVFALACAGGGQAGNTPNRLLLVFTRSNDVCSGPKSNLGIVFHSLVLFNKSGIKLGSLWEQFWKHSDAAAINLTHLPM